jgi:diguanylate cyclase (GGDEF)-like protein/PAS domain S-box-containing protein
MRVKACRAGEIHRPFRILERGKSGYHRSLMHPGRLITRHTVLSLCFVLLYLALNLPQVILISQLGSVAWYPATGLVLALLLGVSPWYAVLICLADALAGAMFYHQPLTSFGETAGSAGVAVCYGTAAYVLRGPLQIDLGLRRRQDVVRYVFVTLVAAMAATVIGVACLAADKSIPWSEFWPTAWVWFSGDGIGLLGVAPFLLIHVFPWVRRQLSPTAEEVRLGDELPRREIVRFDPAVIAEVVGQAVAIMVVLWVMFGPQLGSRQLFYLSVVPIIWIAMRQGIRRAVGGMLALNFGMVVAMHLFPPAAGVPSKVGLLMLVISGVGLIVGSAVSERHRIALDLQEQTAHLNSLIENSPFGIVVLDRQGVVELTNAAFDKLFRFDQRELKGGDLNCIFVPDDDWTESTLSIEKVIAGETLHTTAKRRRKDGQILDLEVHAVPLIVDARVQGSYMIYKDISEQIRASQAERQHAEVLSQLVSELQLRTKQMTLLSEMGDLLECCGTTQEACAVVAQSVQKLLPEAVSGTLYLFKSSRNLVEAAARWGGDSVSESMFSPDACWSLRRGQAHWNERAGGISCAHLLAGSTNKCLCVPMVGQGDTLGVLHLEFAGDGGARTDSASENPQDSQQRVATTVAAQIALSLASLRLRETLRDQSIRDPLTGLFNRRFMEESLDREMQRAVRKNHPVSVLFVDLDHFKRFNDTFGHDAGDLVLRSIADLFRQVFRVDDVICRYGGEEFGIILPESSAENAAIRANGLREAVKKLEVRYKNHTLGTITLSIGVATFPEHGDTSEELLKAADQCLYQSKAGGRDLVTVAPRRRGDRDLAEVERGPE